MDDSALAGFICPDDLPKGLKIVEKLTPERRATLERMSDVCNEIYQFAAGLGPKPTGVILCGPRSINRSRKDNI